LHVLQARNAVFFTRVGKLTIRMAVTAEQLGRSESAKKSGDKLKWGLKLKLADVKKPIIAMAAHPTGQQLMILLEDGNVRGYTLGSTGVVPVFPPTFMLPSEYACRAAWLCSCTTHTSCTTPWLCCCVTPVCTCVQCICMAVTAFSGRACLHMCWCVGLCGQAHQHIHRQALPENAAVMDASTSDSSLHLACLIACQAC
jgi:hypothetical protein